MKKGLGVLGSWSSPGSVKVSQLKECLQRYFWIIHHRTPHIDVGIQTHVLVRYELYPYKPDQPPLAIEPYS